MTNAVLSPEEIARLTPEQRLALIEALWDSLEQDDLPVTAAQTAELDRRMAIYEQDALTAHPWDAVRKRIERNLS